MKIVLITGASSGLGKEFAKQLDRLPDISKDTCLWLVARRKDRLETLERELTHPCWLFPLDLANSNSFKILETTLKEENPEISWLVNGAGLGYYGNVSDLSPEQMDATLTINCSALTKMCRLTAPYFTEKAHVINIASGSAFLPQPGFSVYAASKAYVHSLSLALRRELKKKKVRVCALCSGPVATEFFDTALQTGQTMPEYKKKFMADPEKVVRKSIRDVRKNRNVSAYSFSIKLVWLASKILPKNWILKLLY